MLDRAFVCVCTSSASGPLLDTEYLIFHYICYHGSNDLRLRFIYNLFDLSANEKLLLKDYEKFMGYLAQPRTPLPPSPYPSTSTSSSSSSSTSSTSSPPNQTVTSPEEKDPILRLLMTAHLESIAASRAGKDTSVFSSFMDWRMIVEDDPRIDLLLSCLQKRPKAIYGNGNSTDNNPSNKADPNTSPLPSPSSSSSSSTAAYSPSFALSFNPSATSLSSSLISSSALPLGQLRNSNNNANNNIEGSTTEAEAVGISIPPTHAYGYFVK